MSSETVSKSVGDRLRHYAAVTMKDAWSARKLNYEKDESLIEQTAIIKTCDFPTLIKIINTGDVYKLQQILECQPSLADCTDANDAGFLHHAAECGNVEVIKFLLENEYVDIDKKDLEGRTALSKALLANRFDAVEVLMEYSASHNVLDEQGLTPVHQLCNANLPDMLTAFINHPEVECDQHGRCGLTASMICCMHDNWHCLKILLEHGAKLCSVDDSGLHLPHRAIQTGAIQCLRVIVESAKFSSKGYTAKKMVSFKDAEGNLPLHIAVNSGEIISVNAVLSYGADIDEKQDDGSTPVHFACTKGEKEMVQSMFQHQPDRISKVLALQDSNGHTPLHRAAMFDHLDLVKYLIDQGAQLEIEDSFKRTPLLMASAKAAWRTFAFLLEKGAVGTAVDEDKRTVLHLLVLNGEMKKDYFDHFDKQNLFPRICNARDSFGCTALHYASREGVVIATEKLLGYGAKVVIGNHTKESPLHFAARYGRYNTCLKILDAHPTVINMTDETGRSAIHFAAENGHKRIIELLINRGSIFHKDIGGNTPVHTSVKGGYMEVVNLLLSVNPALINSQDKQGRTPLHLAASYNHAELVRYLLSKDADILHDSKNETFLKMPILQHHIETVIAVIEHDRWQEILLTNNGSCPILLCVKELPDQASMIFDRFITSKGNPNHCNYESTYCFDCLQLDYNNPESYVEFTNKDNNKTTRRNKKKKLLYGPLSLVNVMVKLNSVMLLKHPLVTAYLNMKWTQYGQWIHGTNMALYCLFLAALTYFICNTLSLNHTDTTLGSLIPPLNQPCKFKDILKDKNFFNQIIIPSAFITVFCITNILKECAQLWHQKWKYFSDFENLIEWILYLSSLGFMFPFLLDYSFHFQWECGAIAVFLAWYNYFLFFQRFEMFGIYVVMFIEIMKTLITVLILFTSLFIAFGLSFYVLLSYNPTESLQNNAKFLNTTTEMKQWLSSCAVQWSYDKDLRSESSLEGWNAPWLAVLKTLMMTMGEYDYINTFIDKLNDNDTRTLHYSTSTFVLLVLFIFLMPILLMNLLIGLAVGDIEAVQNNADLKRIATQVEWYTELENKLPLKFMQWRDRQQWTGYPNAKCLGTKLLAKLFGEKNDEADEINDEISKINSKEMKHSSSTPNEARILRELDEIRVRIKQSDTELNKQTQLLRLIVEKMEIKTEADDRDEGVDLVELALKNTNREFTNRKSATRMKALVAAVVTQSKCSRTNTCTGPKLAKTPSPTASP